MLRVNRTFLFIYDLLVALAFFLRYVMTGPVLFGQEWLYWGALVGMLLLLVLLNYISFCHPTPLEIVAYHVNLIMRHPVSEEDDDIYDEKNKLYLSERFLESKNYQFFYYEDCCAKTDQYHRMKIKLAIDKATFNHASIIIKTMDEQYIRFNMIKETDYSMLAFLYEWKLDEVEYSDKEAFDKMVKAK
ncbi:MAG: hypothetical protein K2G70_05025 [Turicibacter sp.]|nr:hypothetical protein [Turicibacter sp.]